ncbi:MAG TPA: gephyrin-like molybdotransferase Glp [Terriglobales bacterium]|nr:gephyrin-like molybdotransferase Glp [Terriglobales bacterium]
MAARAEPAPILTFEEARHLVEAHAAGVRPRGKDLVELLDAAGQVLAEPVVADRNFPPFRRATRDGYALRVADLGQLPAKLEVVGEIKAGASLAESAIRVGAGQAASIMTGAPVPDGADGVVMVEYTSREGDSVLIARPVASGDNVVPAGSEAKRGERLLEPGVRLDHAAIAMAASVGRAHLLVYSPPRVAVLSTGDELVELEDFPGPNQIRNSNSYSLAAQIKAAGGEPVLLPIARDESLHLRELIADGLESDLLLLTGGVSMGKYDLVEQVLAEFRAEFFFTGVKIQPGKPLVFGRIPGADGGRYFFGLPGNPVSTMVTFELFARPMLEALAGRTRQKLIFLHARLKTEVRTKTGLKRFLPGMLSGEFEQAEVELARWQGSGDVAAAARANCYIVIPPDRERIAAGEWVAVMRK